MPYFLGEVSLPEDALQRFFSHVSTQVITGQPNVDIVKPYEPKPLPVKPPIEEIPFEPLLVPLKPQALISPAVSENYILPMPPKPEPFLSREDWERFFSLLRSTRPRPAVKREITVTTPKKLRFFLVVAFNEPLEMIDESLLKDKFENELRFKAPSWEITCTSFVKKGGMYKRGGFYYGIMADLVVRPREGIVGELCFVPNSSDLIEREFEMRLYIMPRIDLEMKPLPNFIVFNEVMAKIFNVPSATVYWEYVYMDEITGALSPGVLVYSEVSPAIIHWGDLIKPQPLPIDPQPFPIKPPPEEIPIVPLPVEPDNPQPQPVAPVIETPVGGMVPVSEEKKDEKTEKKKFPWWIVIVVAVVVLFFVMKNK